ncbi:hypothetical protein HXX01_00255 [Candidatus Nomurabacteria bacterium]|nr:hypothetical protein [Candidatus Nomurabacteria bacterium]
MNNKAFICYANQCTETECLEKMIFGFGTPIQFMGETEQNETWGFLYNYESDELIGPFRAISKMNLKIDLTAFQGRYPYQVKVSLLGDLLRKKAALSYIQSIGIQVYRTKSGRILPSHQITSKNAETLDHWLNNDTIVKSQFSSDISDAYDSIIEECEYESSKKVLLEVRKAVSNKKRIKHEEADKLLIQLRDGVIKKEQPVYDDSKGLLRKSIKNILLDKKISSHDQFDEMCKIRQIEYDGQQAKYFPIIFEIIMKLPSSVRDRQRKT